jgi:hypothetical protein
MYIHSLALITRAVAFPEAFVDEMVWVNLGDPNMNTYC